MSYRPHGKYVSIDANSPEALGICDYSGFVFTRADLVKQFEYRGNDLVWTGFYVGKPYLDEPNPQLKPPNLPPDPIPVKDPRSPQGCMETFSNNTLPIISEIDFPINQIGNISDGALAPSAAERLVLLQNSNPSVPGNYPNLLLNGAPTPVEQSLTQAEILQQLQNATWMTP